MNIRSVIIDDEPNNVENLQSIISIYCPWVKIAAVAFNAVDGRNIINIHKPDLVFLDIQMPNTSGFDLLRTFNFINFKIIFITAHDQYALQAIKFSALDYLLKPINIDEFKLAIHKAEKRIVARERNHNIENLLENINTDQNEAQKIALSSLQGTLYVKITDIVRCEAESNYTHFFLANKERIMVCKTLKEFAEMLKSHQFIRTHQSHLVNIHFVKNRLKDGGTLLLIDSTKIPISRQNRDKVKEALSDKKFILV